MARMNIQKAAYMKNQLEAAGFELPYKDAFFNEVVVNVGRNIAEVNKKLLAKGFIGGYDLGRMSEGLSEHMLLAVTEIRTKEEIDQFVKEMGIFVANQDFPLIFELSQESRTGFSLPELDVPEVDVEGMIGEKYVRKQEPDLPEVSELQIIRHYTGLSKRNHGVDSGFYPLGSCTMKYNPKMNEDVARFPGFSHIHPYQPEETVQGALHLMYDLQESLAAITGMDTVTLQPAAGAHGEWTGLMMIRAYHEANGDYNRTKVIVPDSAHGTNPASATVAGFEAVTVKSDDRGLVDLEDLKRVVDEETAALMLTNPNTLGLFEEDIEEMAAIVHEAGGKLYYDGANLNAVLGYARPGDMGFDVVHLNLHKTFTGPHGGEDLVPGL